MPGLRSDAGVTAEDSKAIDDVRAEILLRLEKSHRSIEDFFGSAIRRAIDEVLSLGAKRYSIGQLAPPEQAYIGTRVEMLVRDGLDVGKGARADALIAGHEVDLKWSRSLGWMIGPENIGTICLGIGMSKRTSDFSVGLFVPREGAIARGRNRDRKFTLTAEHKRIGVIWLIQGAPTPENFVESLSQEVRDDILRQPSAQARLRRFAELVPERPIPRAAIVFVSLNKDDALRRVREDKSRRSPPLGDMVCLSEKYGRHKLRRLGVRLPSNHFYFVKRSKTL